ncbi:MULTISPECIES: NAD(P)/FAD-dependent oxidoreductase [unclassified Haematobacter]|uniref:NAD(P)/FAD-dependent oxidoreductase n=1 Tax=unclassified Haematobacter TaxID=2640585 RepID=UPI0025BC595C|nr:MULTISPECIES: FAD-binding oxidoreductase [unclassified Haematobacter]
MRNGEVSFWFADAGGVPAPRPALDGDRQVDVCIIGAGFTGLWTAYYLKAAEPGLSIAVVEKEFAGFGASGRNGGWCSGEFGWSRERYRDRPGVIAMEAQLRATVEEVIRLAEAEGIAADIRRTDLLTFACNPAQLSRLDASLAEARAWQVPTERFSRIGAEAARSRIRVAGAEGALVTHGVARVQPAKLVRGLAAAVERRGVAIHEQTAVTAIAPGIVTTDRGRITAGRIVIATEGFTPRLPGRRRDLLPLNSALVVTEPLPDALWEEIGWREHELLADNAHAYCYAQRTAGNRIAMGGRGVPYRFGSALDHRGETQAATIADLRRILHNMLPQTKGLRLDHAWCGVLGVPRDWCAAVSFDAQSGMGRAGGYVGLGVSTTNLAGRTLADLLLDRRTERTGLPWVDHDTRRWEPEPLRWLGVMGMYGLYRQADRQEARAGVTRTSRLATLADRLTGH